MSAKNLIFYDSLSVKAEESNIENNLDGESSPI